MTGNVPPENVTIRNQAGLDRQPCRGADEPCARGFLEWLLEIGGQK